MSRSRRKTPISGYTTSESNKPFKQQEHRRERRHVNCMLTVGKYDDMPHHKKYGNEWASPRDGKGWWGDYKYGGLNSHWIWARQDRDEHIRECKEFYKKLMRK